MLSIQFSFMFIALKKTVVSANSEVAGLTPGAATLFIW